MKHATITPNECLRPERMFHNWDSWPHEPNGDWVICRNCRMIHRLEGDEVLVYGEVFIREESWGSPGLKLVDGAGRELP